jgi:hypothetical protein
LGCSLLLTSLLLGNVVLRLVLKGIFTACIVGEVMLKNSSAKLMVYASTGLSSKRLESVRSAAQQTAKRLNMDFQIVKSAQSSSPIYVYYEGDGAEPVPLYCDEGKMSNLEEITSAIKNMMFVLSFHPRQTSLRSLRSEIVKLS